MDRRIVYPGSLPQDLDILATNKAAMIAIAKLAGAVIGINPSNNPGATVHGLAVTPTSPASMSVSVGPGAIFAPQPVDATAYGSIAADSSDTILKCGVALGSTSIPLTAPSTSGQSINYLIEAAFSETDTGAVVLPYVNAANPAVPYSGPNNSGLAQAVTRQQSVTITSKAGAAAATGSQATPAPDSGYVGLYVVTVPYGATSITSADISTYPGAPFIPQSLLATANVNGNASEQFTASQFTTGQSVISTGSTLLLQNNGYVATVNEANSGYVEMYVAPATAGQAAVNLSQFSVSGSASNSGVSTNISTSASFTPATKCLILVNGNVGSTEGITSCGLSFTGAASINANQSNWSGGGGTTVSSLGASTAQITVDAGTACTITMSAASAGSMTIGFNFIGIPVQ